MYMSNNYFGKELRFENNGILKLKLNSYLKQKEKLAN